MQILVWQVWGSRSSARITSWQWGGVDKLVWGQSTLRSGGAWYDTLLLMLSPPWSWGHLSIPAGCTQHSQCTKEGSVLLGASRWQHPHIPPLHDSCPGSLLHSQFPTPRKAGAVQPCFWLLASPLGGDYLKMWTIAKLGRGRTAKNDASKQEGKRFIHISFQEVELWNPLSRCPVLIKYFCMWQK